MVLICALIGSGEYSGGGAFLRDFCGLNLEHMQMHSVFVSVHSECTQNGLIYYDTSVSRKRLLTQFWILTAKIGFRLQQFADSSNFQELSASFKGEKRKTPFNRTVSGSLCKHADNKNLIFTFSCKLPVIDG